MEVSRTATNPAKVYIVGHSVMISNVEADVSNVPNARLNNPRCNENVSDEEDKFLNSGSNKRYTLIDRD